MYKAISHMYVNLRRVTIYRILRCGVPISQESGVHLHMVLDTHLMRIKGRALDLQSIPSIGYQSHKNQG